MRFTTIAGAVFSGILVLIMTACSKQDMKKIQELMKKELPEPKYIITVNSIVKYPRAKELEKEIDTFTGRKIWVNTNSFIHAKSIEEIKLIPRDKEGNFYDLELKLSNHGKLIWMQLSTAYSYKKLAFVVDGVFYRSFIPKPIKEGDDYALVEGPFDKYTAEQLKKYAKTNFEYFNQR
jgi:hypothetical protein